MGAEQIIKEAMRSMKPIKFEYIKDGKVRGIRIGNPHIIFGHSATQNISVHIYQTEGVSDTQVQLPGWRQFLLNCCHDVEILADRGMFQIAEGYNPNSPMYGNILSKV